MGAGRVREKGCVGSYRWGDRGIIGGLLVGSLLGVWGEEGRFWWKIEPEYGRQDQQKVI